MPEKLKSPEVRFKGFNDDWEQRKLGRYSKIITKGTTPTEKTTSGTINFIKVENIRNGRIFPVSKINLLEHTRYLKRSILEEHDILFSIAGTLGRTAVVEKSVLPANTNQALSIIRGYDFDINFLTTSLSGNVVREYIRRNPTVGAQPNLSLKQVGDLIISTPCSKEQIKIGQFFKTLDDTIALHQRKHLKLQNIKKAMLEKMLPQNGNGVPEIRFAGFTDDWEQHKLGDIGEIVTGSTPPTSNKSYYLENGVPWITPTDIKEDITCISARCLSGEGVKVARIVPKDSILVTCIASIGKNTLMGNEGSFNQQINAIIPNFNNYNSYYLYSSSSFWSRDMMKVAGAGGMLIVNNKLFSEITTYAPTFPEQSKIGQFFKTLDDTITLHQHKLKKLKNIKKAMLDKMFVQKRSVILWNLKQKRNLKKP